jgi:hypothetical protein
MLLRQAPVVHLLHDGRQAAHIPSPVARVLDDHLVYDLDAAPRLL